MMRYLTAEEVLELHRMAIERSGGSYGIRDLGALESAVAQPQMTFGGQELYPNLVAKAAALGFSLVCSHPFVDGNKRVGHAALETFLVLNEWELAASIDEQEQISLRLASGDLKRDEFAAWVESRLQPHVAK
jgi:death-on-curing protein